MRIQRITAATGYLIAGFIIAGCSTPEFNQGTVRNAGRSPVSYDRVQLFEAGMAPKASFEIISALSVEGYSPEEYQVPLQTKAGELGANAVIAVHNFSAPRVIGTRSQSGIAVRLLPEGQIATGDEAQSAVAIVVLVEAVPRDMSALPAIRDTIEVFAAMQLHYRGYCPIHVGTSMPVGEDVPVRATYDLLRGSEARICEKMLVLRLTGREQVNAGVFGWAHFNMTAQLITKNDSRVIWSKDDHSNWVGIGIYPAVGAKSTSQVYAVVTKALRDLPENR